MGPQYIDLSEELERASIIQNPPDSLHFLFRTAIFYSFPR